MPWFMWWGGSEDKLQELIITFPIVFSQGLLVLLLCCERESGWSSLPRDSLPISHLTIEALTLQLLVMHLALHVDSRDLSSIHREITMSVTPVPRDHTPSSGCLSHQPCV